MNDLKNGGKNGGYGSASELRKQILITQGAMFRSGLVLSRATVKASLQGGSLGGKLVKHAGSAALSLLRARGAGLSALAPLAVSGLSKLWKGPGKKNLWRGLLIAGGVAAAAAIVLMTKRKAGAEEGDESASAPEAADPG
ncbi:MAG: hypothetical protein JO269_01720 [Burkholderiaceae bacterium]|nr:hypothetical protein [Burkholderiaceae bacterium]